MPFSARRTPGRYLRAISGFGQPVVITLLGLFILTRGLDQSGATRWIARQIVKAGGKSETRLIALFAGTTALLSLFMNNLAAGALLLPGAMEASRRPVSGRASCSSRLPTAACWAGRRPTSPPPISSSATCSALPARRSPPGYPGFHPTGGLIAIAGIAFLALFGPRLLPNRTPPPMHAWCEITGRELEDYYRLDERRGSFR